MRRTYLAAAPHQLNDVCMGTTSGLYVSTRGNFHYVASWEVTEALLKWTAVVRQGKDGPSKFLGGETQIDRPDLDFGWLVRRQVEDRIDRAAWLD